MPSIITRGGMSAKALGFGASTSESAVYIEDVFSTYLYTGNGSSQTITNGIDLSTKGGMVWIKYRTVAAGSCIFDTTRGANNYLRSSDTNQSSPGVPSLTSFNTNGFSLGNGGLPFRVNAPSGLFVSWSFRKQPKFFTQLAYTGTGSATTIIHDLGCVPGMIIVKRTDTTGDWQVYHKGLTSAAYSIQLNLTNAQASAATVWNSTAPTSSVFSVGTDATVNASGGTYVAYLFADSNSGGFGAAGADSVVACGSLSASSSTTVTLGWEPQYVLLKQSSGAQNWYCVDAMRGMSYRNFVFLQPNVTDAEADAGTVIQPTATGFVFKGANLGATSGETYIYLAIRRGPMKTPTDATKVYQPIYSTTNLGNQVNGTVGPMDITIQGQPTGAYPTYWMTTFDRLRWNYYISTAGTSAESSGGVTFDTQVGVKNGSWFTDGGICYNFARAPGYCDVVCYSGLGTSQNYQNHNLKVAPELIIWKSRSNATDWAVWCKYTGSSSNTNFAVYLNSNAGSSDQGFQLTNVTLPTSTVFTMWDNAYNNASGYTYVAYLFATCAGVSKVGSYSGTGAAQNIDCGFSAGARFVLIKRTDSTGDWYTYDSARGISASTDPYLLLNSTAAEVTGTDYVNTYSTGFSLTASAPSGLNANGGSYIFLAIA